MGAPYSFHEWKLEDAVKAVLLDALGEEMHFYVAQADADVGEPFGGIQVDRSEPYLLEDDATFPGSGITQAHLQIVVRSHADSQADRSARDRHAFYVAGIRDVFRRDDIDVLLNAVGIEEFGVHAVAEGAVGRGTAEHSFVTTLEWAVVCQPSAV